MSGTVKIGDTVVWRGSWGRDAPVKAKVIAMDITEEVRSKYGEPVEEAPWFLVKENRVIFHLDNERWAYGSQITPAQEE
jgi:hypothetical protein|tara:strand:- start:642 stop:878 length:237 start_codon:yes stop_codon:yes gene_type:complete